MDNCRMVISDWNTIDKLTRIRYLNLKLVKVVYSLVLTHLILHLDAGDHSDNIWQIAVIPQSEKDVVTSDCHSDEPDMQYGGETWPSLVVQMGFWGYNNKCLHYTNSINFGHETLSAILLILLSFFFLTKKSSVSHTAIFLNLEWKWSWTTIEISRRHSIDTTVVLLGWESINKLISRKVFYLSLRTQVVALMIVILCFTQHLQENEHCKSNLDWLKSPFISLCGSKKMKC